MFKFEEGDDVVAEQTDLTKLLNQTEDPDRIFTDLVEIGKGSFGSVFKVLFCFVLFCFVLFCFVLFLLRHTCKSCSAENLSSGFFLRHFSMKSENCSDQEDGSLSFGGSF